MGPGSDTLPFMPMSSTPSGEALQGVAARLGEPATNPADAISVETVAVRPPRAGEVRVRMRFAPVNPADLNVLQGTYGRRPVLPATPGIEGVGTVLDVGDGVCGFETDDVVVPLGEAGTWASHVVAPAADLLRLPKGIDLHQAAMLRVNPATADRMLALPAPESAGAVVFNAANSAVGRCLLQLTRDQGRRAAAFLRAPERFPELSELAGPTVRLFEDSPDGAGQAGDWLGAGRAGLALNAVGGDSALRLMTLLAPGGLHVTYGAMGRQPLKVPNRFLIFHGLHLQGFWLTRWLGDVGAPERDAVYHRLAGRIAEGRLTVPVDQVLPLSEVRAAVDLAGRSGRAGKVLLAL